MILTQQQLDRAMHGWVSKHDAEGYAFYGRFTKKQMDYYASTVFAGKENASAGVYFELETDAEALRFDFRITMGSSQKYYFFDLFVDGKLTAHVGKQQYCEPDYGTFEQSLPEGTHCVRVYFPNLSQAAIRNVELKGATVAEPTEKLMQYVAYGDSITQGYIASVSGYSYANLVGRALGADLYNLGIGGEIFNPDMVDEDYPVKADVVTIAYGTNDWSHVADNEAADRDRMEFLRKVTKTHEGAKIFLLLPIWRGNGGEEVSKAAGTLEDYRERMRKDARQFPQITVIEGIGLVPHHPLFYYPDVLHPADLGFLEYAQNLLDEIATHL